jgi:hypothetical protein
MEPNTLIKLAKEQGYVSLLSVKWSNDISRLTDIQMWLFEMDIYPYVNIYDKDRYESTIVWKNFIEEDPLGSPENLFNNYYDALYDAIFYSLKYINDAKE